MSRGQDGVGILLFPFLDSGIHRLMGLVGCVSLLFRHVVVVVTRGGYRNKIIVCSEVGDLVPGGVPLDLKPGGGCAVGVLFVLHKYLPPLTILTKYHHHYLTPILMHHSRAIGATALHQLPSSPWSARRKKHQTKKI